MIEFIILVHSTRNRACQRAPILRIYVAAQPEREATRAATRSAPPILRSARRPSWGIYGRLQTRRRPPLADAQLRRAAAGPGHKPIGRLALGSSDEQQR